ncbi:phage head morphogenesis protein [Solimonas flava]|uniref:phage head morphogenesis protein n=1 Tax=Solimonas flava TaxID=415849 RepID=UPI00041768E8|nr:phage minor head protein [Solimonas flava]
MAEPSTPPVAKDALGYFRAKKLRPAFDYRDVWRDEHVAALTVAKVTQADVLGSISDSLDKALADGQSFDTWRKQIRPELEKAGWWGKRDVVDEATGEIRTTEIGAPSRLRKIYETNMRMARATGQWERMQRNKRVLPYVLRELGPSAEHRPEHVAWHGVLLPIDDPWVQSHPCPCGWGCKCGWRQVGRVEYQRLVRDGVPGPAVQQVNPETGLPTGHVTRERVAAKTVAPPIELRPWKNKRTGQTEMVPKGVDPGFDFNPGAVYRVDQQARQVARKLPALPADIGAEVWQLTEDRVLPVLRRDFERSLGLSGSPPMADTVGADSPALTIGAVDPALVRKLGELGAAPASAEIAVERTVAAAARSGTDALSADELRAVPLALMQPERVLLDRETGRLIYLFAAEDAGQVLAVDVELVTELPKSALNLVRSARRARAADFSSLARFVVLRRAD